MTAARPPIVWIAGVLAIPVLAVIGFIAGAEPKFGIVAALAMVYALVVFTNLSAALTILVVIVFAESTPLAGPALSATKIAGLLLALGWLTRVATREDQRRAIIFNAHPALSYLLVLFVGWVFISIIWAQDVAIAVDQATVFLLVAILYVIVYTAVRTRRDAMHVIGAFVLGTAFTAVYGLIVRPDPNEQAAERLASTINDPNFLAAILVAGIVLAGAGFFAARGHRLLQSAALASVLLCLVAFVLTGSRGGIIGLAAALIAAIAFGGRMRLQITFAAIAVTTLTIGYYTTLAPPLLKERIASATEGEVSRADTRSTIWTVAWRMAMDHPVAGVGIGNFAARSIDYVIEPGTTYRTDRVIDNPGVSHNTFLGPFAEIGIVGLALFLSIVGFSIACTVQAVRRFVRNRDGPMEMLARGLFIALIGVLASAFFISAESNKFIWLMLAMGPALLAVAEAGSRVAEPARRRGYRGGYRPAPSSAAVRPLARPS
ncbi:MAG TPA: O-antigen ligase family protein [Solirubrobacterales bacterium]|nr:O-antigen ligase family protein [Solirubrobacterales bacterium]